MPTVAEQIVAQCAMSFNTPVKEDCNQFVKAVAVPFFEPDLFTGPNMNADAIIEEMNSSALWNKLGTSHTAAISDAGNGKFVVAGMTSAQLSSAHGHVAVVVGDPGQLSGQVLVPICYAGSLSAGARVARSRVSATFGATNAQQNKIYYFSRIPQTVPSRGPVDLLIDHLRGLTEVLDTVPHVHVESRLLRGSRRRGPARGSIPARG